MFKQLVNIIVQTFSKGSGLDKVAKDADKATNKFKNLQGAARELGKVFGSVGGLVGGAISKIFGGSFFEAGAMGIRMLIDKWKEHKQKVEEAKKAQEEALGQEADKRVKEHANAISEIVDSWEKTEKAISDANKAEEDLWKAQDRYVQAVRRANDELINQQELKELNGLSPNDKEGEERVRQKYDTIRKREKAGRESEDSLVTEQRAEKKLREAEDKLQRTEQSRLDAEQEIASIKKRIEELENANPTKEAYKTIGYGYAGGAIKQKVQVLDEEQIKRNKDEAQKLRDEIVGKDGKGGKIEDLKKFTDDEHKTQHEIEVLKKDLQTAKLEYKTSVIKSQNTQLSIDHTRTKTEDDTARKQALSQLQNVYKQSQQTTKYASQSALDFNPQLTDYRTRSGGFNFGAYNSATAIDNKLDYYANEASKLEGTIQQFIDSGQAQTMAIDELTKAISRFTTQVNNNTKKINNTVERSKRIQ